MQAGKGAAIARIAGQNVQQDLADRDDGAGHRGQHAHGVMARPRPVPDVEDRPDRERDERHPLQQAERTGQFAAAASWKPNAISRTSAIA